MGAVHNEQNTEELGTEGTSCWYCFRVWNVKYMMNYSQQQLKTMKGGNHDLHEEFDRWLHWLIQELLKQYEENADRDLLHVASWPSKEKLLTMDIRQGAWTKPPKRFLPLDVYKEKFGDPAARGDVVTDGPDGVKLVRVQAEETWKRTEKILYQAVKKRTIDDGEDALTSQLMDQRLQTLGTQLGMSESPPASSQTPAKINHQPFSSPRKKESPPQVMPHHAPPAGKPAEQPAEHPQPKASGGVGRKRPTKASGGAGAKASASGKRGRPKRDASSLLRAALRELSVADSSSKFFHGRVEECKPELDQLPHRFSQHD